MIYLKTSVGIEIRGEDLILSSLQGNLSGAAVTSVQSVANFRQRPREQVLAEIDAFFKSKGLGRDNVVLGIPRRDLVFRHLDLPAEVADNIKQVVLYQVQSYAPTEEDKFYYDYSILHDGQKSKRLLILLIMIQKVILDEYLSVLGGLGIRPVAVTGSSVALASLFLHARKNAAGKTFFLADLTPESMEIVAVRNGALLYSREVARGESATWKDSLLREIEIAAGKIRMGQDDSIEKILLAGDSAESTRRQMGEDMPDCGLIGREINFTVPQESKPYIDLAASSIGLAFAGMARRAPLKINLLPPELRIRRNRWAYVTVAILGLAILGLLAALGFRQMIQERILVQKLDQEIQALKGPSDRVQAIRAESEALEKRITFIEELLGKRDMNLEVIRELTAIMPPDTFLSVYNNRSGSIQLAGSSSSAPDLIPLLEKSALLKDVVQRGTIFKDAQTGKDRFNFEAKLER
jgi:Tfp pilus assembly protein PilN